MTRVLSFEMRGSAKSKGSLTSYGPGRMVEAVAGSKEWREDVARAAALASLRPRWTTVERPEPVRVEATFYFARPPSNRDEHPTRRSTYDADKLARNLLDALQDAHVIEDDSQVIDLRVLKNWATDQEPPGVTVRIHAPS